MFAASAAAVIQVAAAGFAAACPCDGGQSAYVPIQPALTPPAMPADDQRFLNPPLDAFINKQPGEIIAAREVRPAFESLIQPDVDAWQLSFRSTNSKDEPIAAVTTVMKPRGGSPTNLMSFQVPEDAVAAHCAPSYTTQVLALPPNYAGTIGPNFMLPIALYAITKGWAVSIPDHQGLLSAFAAGPLAGRITLDAARATEDFKPMNLPGRDTKIALWGDSGGSIPTMHAAEQRGSYAPDLKVVGAVSGSTISDMRDIIDYQNNGPVAGTVFTGIIGVSREYPELQGYLDQHMNPLGQGLRAIHSNVCQGWSVSAFPNMNIKGLFDTPDFTREPLPAQIMDKVRLGHATPDMPVYMFQSNGDWIVPAYANDRLVDNYCKDPDARITYRHITVGESYTQAFFSVPGTFNWLQDRYNGVPVANGCDRAAVGAISQEDSPEMQQWLDIAGPKLTAEVKAKRGY